MLVSEGYKDKVETISASTSYGGNPMACAAALASIEVIQEENICERSWSNLSQMAAFRLESIECGHYM